MSAVLAGPTGECCYKGVKHSGTPVGKDVNIAGLSTYVSEPKGEPKAIILFFSDVFGPFYVNNQLLQDYFAENGFLVLGVDYFFGDGIHKQEVDPNFDKGAWIANSRAKAAERTPQWIEAVREQYGTNQKYFAVGYCFGGPYALNIAGTDQVIAAAFAHPAFLIEDQFRNLKRPFMILASETDHTFPPEARRRAIDILSEIKATYHLRVFSGVSHGFATRGDSEDENSRWAKEESAVSVISFFSRFLKA